MKEGFRDASLPVRNPVAIGALAVLGTVATMIVLYVVYLIVWFTAIFSGAFGPTVDREWMDWILVADYEELRVVADYFISLDYNNVSIRFFDQTDIFVSESGYHIAVSDDEVSEVLRTLQKDGFWAIGKRDNGIYFQRSTEKYGETGFIYSLNGDVPANARFSVFYPTPLMCSCSNWFYFNDSDVSSRNIAAAQEGLSDNYERFTKVINYFAEIEYRRIIATSASTSIYVSHTGYIQVQDAEARNAFESLYRQGYRSIKRQDNVIIFHYSSVGRHFGNGIVYSIDGVVPNYGANSGCQLYGSRYSPTQIMFLTELEPLSKQNWFYYEEDFRAWRTRYGN